MSAQGKAPRDTDAANTISVSEAALVASDANFASDVLDNAVSVADQLTNATVRSQHKYGSTGALSNADGRSNPAQRAFEDAV